MSLVTHFRRCIRIKAEDCPNVQIGLAQQRLGLPITHENIVPGVITFQEYLDRKRTMNPARQCVSLGADWWEGAEEKLTPREWLDAAEQFWVWLMAHPSANRPGPRWLGIDSGEGGDDTCWCVIDRLQVHEILSIKTPDTNWAYGQTLEVMRQWDIPPERTVLDLGGGGKEHVDRLRASGRQVRAIRFGKQPSLDPKRGTTLFEERRETKEDADAYVSRRSEMAWDVRMLLERTRIDQADGTPMWSYVNTNWYGHEVLGFAMNPQKCRELRRQLAAIPLGYDHEGRFKLIPKQNPTDPEDPKTFRYLIGRSPDQFDAFCLAVFGMTHKPVRMRAGAG